MGNVNDTVQALEDADDSVGSEPLASADNPQEYPSEVQTPTGQWVKLREDPTDIKTKIVDEITPEE